MSENRFSWETEKLQHSDDEVIMVIDNANKEWKGHILNIVDLLNSLAEENEQLKRSLENNRKKAGSIVGESTQTLNKVSNNDDDNIFEITM